MGRILMVSGIPTVGSLPTVVGWKKDVGWTGSGRLRHRRQVSRTRRDTPPPPKKKCAAGRRLFFSPSVTSGED